jgi:hypothetical protein
LRRGECHTVHFTWSFHSPCVLSASQ